MALEYTQRPEGPGGRWSFTDPACRARVSSGCLAEDQHRVEPTEGKGVGHGVCYFLGASDVGHIVEIALRIRLGQADRCRDEALLDRFDAGDRLDATACTQQVAVHRLCRGDGNLVGRIAE